MNEVLFYLNEVVSAVLQHLIILLLAWLLLLDRRIPRQLLVNWRLHVCYTVFRSFDIVY